MRKELVKLQGLYRPNGQPYNTLNDLKLIEQLAEDIFAHRNGENRARLMLSEAEYGLEEISRLGCTDGHCGDIARNALAHVKRLKEAQ